MSMRMKDNQYIAITWHHIYIKPENICRLDQTDSLHCVEASVCVAYTLFWDCLNFCIQRIFVLFTCEAGSMGLLWTEMTAGYFEQT